jgi:hypothetical protein
MKKIFSILAIALLASCTKEEEPKDCNCDRVVSVMAVNIQNAPKQGKFYTVNDCTNLQRLNSYYGTVPKEGTCK